MLKQDYLGILTPQEIENLRAARKDGWTHPVASLALANGGNYVAGNTHLAARQLHGKDLVWLKGLRNRLLDTTDFTNASSALGEIRAYGALLEAALAVQTAPIISGKLVAPEFEADAGDGPVIVEVHSRQMAPGGRAALAHLDQDLHARHAAAVSKSNESGRPRPIVTTGVTGVAPLGAPDPTRKGESVLTNAISRIASIKEKEKQIDAMKPFVLWLDLQDPMVWALPISEEQLSPIFTESKDGHVGSGALWFALYGRKRDPMMEMQGFDYHTRPMLHDGRFHQIMKVHGGPTRITAVVYSLPEATVLMENPSPVIALPPAFRGALLRTPHFRLDLSICEWTPGLVKATVNNQRRTTAAAAKALIALNPP